MRHLSLLFALWSLIGSVWAADPPNVVLIISDDQGWQDYSFMGHPHLRTPHLDRLASESLVYTRGYVPDSLCRPSLATILTGHYPHQHHITGNDPVLRGELAALPRAQALKSPEYFQLRERYSRGIDQFPKLPAILHHHLGHVSLQTGKWWERHFTDGGFSHGMSHGETSKGGRHGDEGLEIGRHGLVPIKEFIDRAAQDQKPFLVWYAPMLPHTPHNPPERLLEYYRNKTPHLPIAKYWAMCEWFDETVGELLGHVEQRGLSQNTIVVYIADNGWVQTSDGEGGASGGVRGKRSQYDGGVRTPIMIRWPGHVTPRRDVEHLASSIDLLPTILLALGIPANVLPETAPGIDLLNEEQIASRHQVFGEIFEHDAIDIVNPAASLRFRWIIHDHWKLIVPSSQREPDSPLELFHITEDPDELRNLATSEPERVASMQKLLNRWWNPEQIPE